MGPVAGFAGALLLTVGSGPAQAQSAPSAAPPTRPAPPITPLRYTEDYSYLENPAKQSGAWWEPFKYIPLDGSGYSHLTLGNEFRVRGERIENGGFGGSLGANDSYSWYRSLPYADLHLGPQLRLFGQLNVAYAAGVEPRTRPLDETGVDVLQSFAELKVPLRTGDDAHDGFTLRLGRQLLSYGSERLIGTRYGPNVLQTFDGGVLRLDDHEWRVDAFFARPVQNGLKSFDDRSDNSRSLWSVYAARALPEVGRGVGLDLYYIGYTDKAARFNQGAGREERHTLGTRFFGTNGGWRWDLEGFYQFGHFGRGHISAWSIASDVRYTFVHLPFEPYAGLKANVISGDKDPRTPDLQSFNALFPRGKYFGEIGLIGPRNLINLHPSAGISLGRGWTLGAAGVFYWRESLGDGVYGNAGNLLRGAQPDRSRARFIGRQGDLVLSWDVDRTLSIGFSYSIFRPGRFIKETGPAETVHFLGAETLARF